jgi:hypothetical protein
MRLEGLGQSKNTITSSVIEPATYGIYYTFRVRYRIAASKLVQKHTVETLGPYKVTL